MYQLDEILTRIRRRRPRTFHKESIQRLKPFDIEVDNLTDSFELSFSEDD
jgi:hypothetical protein